MNKNPFSIENHKREVLEFPHKEKKLVLHSCCAPCAGEIMLELSHSKIETIIFFYNPNIHPKKEYEIRKQENIEYAKKLKMKFIDADYDTDNWFKRVEGLEWEPERGKRCTACFDMRFERTALYAHENGYNVISSTLGISRWKDFNQINGSGERSASKYPNLTYWTYNWRKKGGSQRMIELSKQENFYQQEYCGCVYSLRDTNLWRNKNNRSSIQRGVKFYSHEKKQDDIESGIGNDKK